MSAATTLFAPGFDDTDDAEFPGSFDSSLPRRRHLAAVPAAPVAGPRGVRGTVLAPSRPAVAVAPVAVLLAPEREAAPVRLTRRGMVVLSVLVAAVGGLLVWLAAASAPSEAAGPATGSVPAVVTVTSGETLWSIASRIAPDADPRAEVEHLRTLNHLDDVALEPGQQLRTR